MTCFTQFNVYAQDFLRRSPRVRIGKVLNSKGNVVSFGATSRSIQYLKRGDQILDRQTLLTKDRSQVVLKIGFRSKLTLGPNSKVNFIYLQNENRYLIRLVRGVVRYRYEGSGVPEVFISGKNYGTYYSANEFDAVLKKNRFYFKPEDKSQMVKFERTGVTDKKSLSIGRKEIELLAIQKDSNRPVYLIKDANAKKSPLEKKIAERKAPSLSSDTTLAEAAAIFGDSIDTTSAVSTAEDIFGDKSSSGQSEAANIFGEEVDTKSLNEKLKLRDNIGVRLDQFKTRPLPKVAKEKEENVLEALDISLFLKSTFYSSEPQKLAGDVDNQGFHQDLRINVGNKVKINDVESLTFNAWLEGSNRKEVFNDFGDILDLQSNKKNYLYLNEFYYTYTTRKFDIQFGKKVIKTGKGIIFSPSDSFTPVDAVVPTTPLFLGSFLVSVDYYMNGWTLTGMLLPAIVPSKAPTQNSRWTTLYSDINFNLEQEFPSGFSPKSKQVFLRLEGTKWGTDWQFSLFNGPNNNPVIRNDIVVNNNVPSFTLVQEHVPITFFSAGFSTTFGGLELHGEILNQNAQEGKDDSFTAMMIGFRYVLDTWPKNLGLNSIDIVIEHGRENLRSSQSKPFYALSSIGSRFYQNSWVGTFIFNVNDDFSFNYDFHFDLENKGSAQIMAANYNTGSSQWRLKQESYAGESTSNFGQWENNDNTTLEYIYNF
jgi:hypothetical protein